ncbi:YpoC family protein [Pseudalkalibacillus hwajinpoensis]|uniref:YpoC-like domain-containing protein n=1 Tax=Guptibacillus hwajinpoensis TaxID=208199 RepID=A0A4V5Q1H8_9BACL|nr:hypothetical protein [Pseudalkalibacillus hwajinpoensis]TKD69808.1 hypothetical protein FBF83_11070 [Pseudalkalibacillus hwajinpoensis]
MDDRRVLSNELHHSFFFMESDWIGILKRREGRLPLSFEVMHERGEHTDKPWEAPDTYLNQYFMDWKVINPQLGKLFGERSKCNVTTEMTAQIGYFLEVLFWINGLRASPGTWKEIVDTLPVKPLNGKERIQHLFDLPDHYVSFILLDQLIEEMHKKWKANCVERL